MRHLFVIYFGALVAQLMNIPLYFRGHIYLCLESLPRVARLLLVVAHLLFLPPLNSSLM